MAKQLLMYGTIGGDVTARSFLDDLKALQPEDDIEVRINSEGGLIVDGFAIYNQLLSNPRKKTAFVDGICGSIASVILMAFDRVVMPENAWIVIHHPHSFSGGEADDLRKEAALLDMFDASIKGAYMRRAKVPEAEIEAKMDAEEWLSAEEALRCGFIDEIIPAVKAAAKITVHAENFKAIPERAMASLEVVPAPVPESTKGALRMEKFLALLKEMGFPTDNEDQLCDAFKAKLAAPAPEPQAVIPQPILDKVGAVATDSVDAVMGRFDAVLATAGQASAQALAAKDAEVAAATIRAEIAEARADQILKATDVVALEGKPLDYVRAHIQTRKALLAMPSTTATPPAKSEPATTAPDGVSQVDYDGYMAYISRSAIALDLWAKSTDTDRKAFIEGWKRRNPSKTE